MGWWQLSSYWFKVNGLDMVIGRFSFVCKAQSVGTTLSMKSEPEFLLISQKDSLPVPANVLISCFEQKILEHVSSVIIPGESYTGPCLN